MVKIIDMEAKQGVKEFSSTFFPSRSSLLQAVMRYLYPNPSPPPFLPCQPPTPEYRVYLPPRHTAASTRKQMNISWPPGDDSGKRDIEYHRGIITFVLW